MEIYNGTSDVGNIFVISENLYIVTKCNTSFRARVSFLCSEAVDMEELKMKCKTFECPYLTAEDKGFLKYDLKIYKENFNMLLKLHKKHESLLNRTDD